MEYSDHDLLRGVKAGDQDALELLVRRWYPRVFGYVLKTLGSEQDAYDVTQDVFLSVLQNISSFHPWSQFKSWIFTIAHNKCMDFFRLRHPTAWEDVHTLDLPDPTIPLADQVAGCMAVDAALARLSPTQREAVVLHYFHQFTAKEIARMTQTPLPTIKSRLAASKRLLANYLKEDRP